MTLPKTMYPGMVNSPETTTTNNINESDTIIYVLDPARVPEPPNLMTLGTGTNAETVKVLEMNDNAITVERGFQGVAKSWPAGTVIARNFTEYDYNALKENIEDLEANKETPAGAQAKAEAAAGAVQAELDEHLSDYATELTKIQGGAYQTAGMKRSPIRYRNANSVFVYKRNVIMGGFRFMGEYLKPIAPMFSFPTIPQVVDFSPANLANVSYETAMSTENWYAVFAVANDGESPQYRIMPFLRAYDVAGNVVTLGVGGEFSNDLANNNYPKTAKTYTFANDVFAGAEVLLINGYDGTRNSQFLGQVKNVTANTGATVTLNDIGDLQKGCYFLIAPPDFDHYCYLGSFYFDTAELQNRSDSGEIVRAHTVYLDKTGNGYPLDGDLSTPVSIDFRGFISPLATGIILGIDSSFSTSSVGEFAYFIGSDNTHHILDHKDNKRHSSTENFTFDTGVLPFTFGQVLYITQLGGLQATTRKVHIKGYIEP